MEFCLFSLVFLHVFVTLEGRDNFLKDSGLDIVFPPPTQQKLPGVPEGHLRPLGYQKKPDGRVREESTAPPPHSFHVKHVLANKPLVMRKALLGEPVVQAWEDDSYFKDKYGNITIRTTEKKMMRFDHTYQRMSFKNFILDYNYENWYLTNTIPKEMEVELPLPPMLNCGTYKDRLVEAELWMSSGLTSSRLHSHRDHNLHCVLDGRKDFVVIHNKYKDKFRYKETYHNSGAGYSTLNMEMIDMFADKEVASVPWTWATLHQSDCIFIPAGWLHQVRSYGRSLSYTVQFAPTATFDSSDCNDGNPEEDKKTRRKNKKKAKEAKAAKAANETKEADQSESKKESLKLKDVELVWGYYEGKRKLASSVVKPKSLRRMLTLLMGSGKELHVELFSHFYDQAMDGRGKRSGAQAFSILTSNRTKKTLSRDALTSLSKNSLKEVCNLMNDLKIVHTEL